MPSKYPKEFRQDVIRVALEREPDATLVQIAKDFGIHVGTLDKWLRQARIEARVEGGLSFAEAAAVATARLEVSGETWGDHALIDEGQDLSVVQWQFSRALVAPGEDDRFIARGLPTAHLRLSGGVVALWDLDCRTLPAVAARLPHDRAEPEAGAWGAGGRAV